MNDGDTYAVIETRVYLVRAQSGPEALELFRDKGDEVVEREISDPRTSLVGHMPIRGTR